MRQRVYIETTIPSYLVARPSRDLIRAARQELTREWWENCRQGFDLYTGRIDGRSGRRVMRNDPIVREVRTHREQRAARFEFKVRAIAEDAQSREKGSGHKIVTPPKRERTKP